jgi:hypothetical protein
MPRVEYAERGTLAARTHNKADVEGKAELTCANLKSSLMEYNLFPCHDLRTELENGTWDQARPDISHRRRFSKADHFHKQITFQITIETISHTLPNSNIYDHATP